MQRFNFTPKKSHFKIFQICLLFILLQGCKLYQDPISIDEAVKTEEKGIIKVTMMNGDEYVYESIEVVDNKYYGIYNVDNQKMKEPLNIELIKDVQKQNRKSSKGNNMLGLGVGVLATIAGIMMFQ